MRVFSKQVLEFQNRETGERACTRMLDFAELPDWVTADPLFQWAKADGSLQVIEDKPQAAVKSPKAKAEGEQK